MQTIFSIQSCFKIKYIRSLCHLSACDILKDYVRSAVCSCWVPQRLKSFEANCCSDRWCIHLTNFKWKQQSGCISGLSSSHLSNTFPQHARLNPLSFRRAKKNPLTLLKHSPAANGWDSRDKQVWQLNRNWQQLWIHITIWRLFTYYEKQKIHFWKWLGLIADYCFFSDMSHLFCSHFVQSYTDNVQYNSQASCASCADFTWYESVVM